MSDASVSALNSRLEEAGSDLVTEARFRPNIYATGVTEPFAEDKWRYFRVGSADEGPVFRMNKLCARCVFTTVDPETGEKNRTEPLKTLKTFRYRLRTFSEVFNFRTLFSEFRQTFNLEERKVAGSSPFFGVNLGLHKPGIVKKGDKIYVGKTP